MNFQDLYQILEEVENEPYPVVEEIKPDYQLGKALYNSYAGMYGELTAITQYIYEHVTNDCDRELKKILIKIAIDEMHHLEILGNLLTELGFIPYFMGSRNHKWCSDNVQYKFQSIVAMMQYNIKLEEEAIREYKALMHMTEDTYIIHLITRIIKDEEGHLKVFQMMKEKYATCEPS